MIKGSNNASIKVVIRDNIVWVIRGNQRVQLRNVVLSVITKWGKGDAVVTI